KNARRHRHRRKRRLCRSLHRLKPDVPSPAVKKARAGARTRTRRKRTRARKASDPRLLGARQTPELRVWALGLDPRKSGVGSGVPTLIARVSRSAQPYASTAHANATVRT